MFGGYNGTDMKSVELFNWRKKTLCQLPDLIAGAANFNSLNVNGTALICGGALHNSCLKLNKASKTWSYVCIELDILFTWLLYCELKEAIYHSHTLNVKCDAKEPLPNSVE